jgi:hypothetical protein
VALKVACDRCLEELKEKGAIILSPPQVDDNGVDVVQKYHLCVKCYDWLVEITVRKERRKKK